MKNHLCLRRTFIKYTVLTHLIFCAGCYPMVFFQDIGAYEKDVSKKKEVWVGYKKGETYRLRHDIFLEKIDISKNRMYAAVPPRELTYGQCMLHYSAPMSTEEYNAEPNKPQEIEGILKAGTTIQLDKVLKHGAWLWGSSYTTFAVIKDGPFAGISVDVADISFPQKIDDDFFDVPNLNLLEKVNAP